MPLLVRLVAKDGYYVPERLLRASDFNDDLGKSNNPDWKTVAIDKKTGNAIVPRGLGFRWGEQGKWNLEDKDGKGNDVELELSLIMDEDHDETPSVAFPYFGNHEHDHFERTDHDSVLLRTVPAKKLGLKEGETLVVSVFDLFVANYGLDRGLRDGSCAKSYDENVPYTPAWAEKITGVSKEQIITVAREFASNAEKTNGRSMVILGAGLNHWYHMDMNYRGIINLLVMCGCVGQSGTGRAVGRHPD